jgi:hypothetical protein
MSSGKLTGLMAVLLLSTAAARADVEISNKPTANISCDAGVCTATAQKAVLNVTDLATMLASGDVAVKTGLVAKDIDIDQPLTWSSTSRLTLDAQQSVTVKKQVTVAGQGALTVTTNDAGGAKAKNKTGEFIIVPEHGSVQFWDLSSSLIIDGNAYTLVGDIKTLAADVSANPSGFYALAKPYDASVDGTYATSPIFTDFSGALEGLGNTLLNLSIAFAGGDDVGFFRSVASAGRVSDLTIANAIIKGTTNGGTYAGIGLLAGSNSGIIDRVFTAGLVSFPGGENELPAGLVGGNFGTIFNCYSTVTIDIAGLGIVGGLVALNKGTLSKSASEGRLVSILGNSPGGLVGKNSGLITDTYSLARVGQKGKCCSGGYFGELLGEHENPGQVVNSYAAGEILYLRHHRGTAGGLVGFDGSTSGSLSNTYWDTDKGVSDPSAGAGNIRNDSGITGLTTQQLQSQLPPAFSPQTWGLNPHINHGFPYLLSLSSK